MPRNLKTLAQLQAEINHLRQENAQLRLLFRVILDTAHLAVNGPEMEFTETKFPEEFIASEELAASKAEAQNQDQNEEVKAC
jgi:hypothetical protein